MRRHLTMVLQKQKSLNFASEFLTPALVTYYKDPVMLVDGSHAILV